MQPYTTIPALQPRHPEGHKGDYGRVLILGGVVGMAGAPALAGLAALRSGAGLVTLAVPEPIQPTVAALCPCATSVALPATRTGQINLSQVMTRIPDVGGGHGPGAFPFDAVVIGPGMGRGNRRFAVQLLDLIHGISTQLLTPVVIDADALNAGATMFDQRPLWQSYHHAGCVITPHPGELARMHAVKADAIQADRLGWAERTALALRLGRTAESPDDPVVVLKGAGTIVTEGRRAYVNDTGNPGMATGGSGDVLSGVIAGLLAQGMPLFDAAVLGVHVHGLAGDIAAQKLGQVSMIATDIIDSLPEAFIRAPRGGD